MAHALPDPMAHCYRCPDHITASGSHWESLRSGSGSHGNHCGPGILLLCARTGTLCQNSTRTVPSSCGQMFFRCVQVCGRAGSALWSGHLEYEARGGSSVTLPEEVANVSRGGNTSLVFVEYATLGCLLSGQQCRSVYLYIEPLHRGPAWKPFIADHSP